jgi:hypothetical protein
MYGSINGNPLLGCYVAVQHGWYCSEIPAGWFKFVAVQQILETAD